MAKKKFKRLMKQLMKKMFEKDVFIEMINRYIRSVSNIEFSCVSKTFDSSIIPMYYNNVQNSGMIKYQDSEYEMESKSNNSSQLFEDESSEEKRNNKIYLRPTKTLIKRVDSENPLTSEDNESSGLKNYDSSFVRNIIKIGDESDNDYVEPNNFNYIRNSSEGYVPNNIDNTFSFVGNNFNNEISHNDEMSRIYVNNNSENNCAPFLGATYFPESYCDTFSRIPYGFINQNNTDENIFNSGVRINNQIMPTNFRMMNGGRGYINYSYDGGGVDHSIDNFDGMLIRHNPNIRPVILNSFPQDSRLLFHTNIISLRRTESLSRENINSNFIGDNDSIEKVGGVSGVQQANATRSRDVNYDGIKRQLPDSAKIPFIREQNDNTPNGGDRFEIGEGINFGLLNNMIPSKKHPSKIDFSEDDAGILKKNYNGSIRQLDSQNNNIIDKSHHVRERNSSFFSLRQEVDVGVFQTYPVGEHNDNLGSITGSNHLPPEGTWNRLISLGSDRLQKEIPEVVNSDELNTSDTGENKISTSSSTDLEMIIYNLHNDNMKRNNGR